MPEFGNAFSGLAADRKLTHQELVRAIRMMIAAEYEAVQLYMQLAESIDNELAKAVLKDIADEEIVHAGEFLTLLKTLEPSEADFYAEGEEEVQELMAELGGSSPGGESPAAGETLEADHSQVGQERPTVGNLFAHD
jgi:rubrerythrin